MSQNHLMHRPGKNEMQPPTKARSAEMRAIAENLYENSFRHVVETPENIGKMIIIEVNSKEYALNFTGSVAAAQIYAKKANAELFGIRIGDEVAASLGGAMNRRAI